MKRIVLVTAMLTTAVLMAFGIATAGTPTVLDCDVTGANTIGNYLAAWTDSSGPNLNVRGTCYENIPDTNVFFGPRFHSATLDGGDLTGDGRGPATIVANNGMGAVNVRGAIGVTLSGR